MIAAEPICDFGEAAARLLGEAPMIRGPEAFFTCPFCGKPQRRRKFSINIVNGLWRCWSCDEHGAFRSLAGGLGQHGDAPSPIARPRAEADPLPALASPEARDRAYSTLLGALALDERHRDTLHSRGFSDAEIEAGGYRSLPRDGRAQLAAQTEGMLGTTALEGVPGFYREGSHWAISGPAGACILIPVRSEDGLVVGIQVRPDVVASGGKYRWFSSSGRSGGTPARAELHFAWPTGRPDPGLRTAWITEGPLKANAAASRLDVLVVAAPGVGLWRSTELIRRLRDLGIEAVVIAYDADAQANLMVAKSTDELADALLLNGRNLSIATWDQASAKGIDDLLLLTDQRPRLLNLRDWRERLPEQVRARLPRHRGAVDIPAEEMPQPTPLEPLVSLHDARSRLAEMVSAALRRPYARSTDVFADPPGTGKTAAWLDRLIALRRDGPWPLVDHWLTDDWDIRRKVTVPMRLAAVFPNRQAMLEAYNSRPELAEFVCLREGRTPDDTSEWYCANFEEAQRLGARRHSVRLEVCPDCPFFDGCPYLASLERARQAHVVFAVHQSFLNAADELGADWDTGRRPAHTVIIEEELLPGLVEAITLDLGCLTEWAEGILHNTDMAEAGQLVEVLGQGLLRFRRSAGGDPIPALPVLQEAAEAVGRTLDGLVAGVDSVRNMEDRRYTLWPFEQARRHQIAGAYEWVVPIRAFSDLVKILREELADTHRARRQTRIWVARQQAASGRREPALLLEVPRRQVIGHLRRATLINLNATPNQSLFQLLFPRARFHQSRVATPAIITQVDNSLYTRAYLRQSDKKALSAVQAAIDGIADHHRRVAVFCPMALEPGPGAGRFVAPPSGQVTWGHFGAQTRSLNSYSDGDAIVVAGHHMWAPFQAEALVQALRWTSRRKKFPSGTCTSRRRPYVFRRPDGSGRGRIVHGHADPLVQATLDWSTEAEITQAIGRARAINRPEGQPVHVYVLTAAVTNLPVDRLLSMPDLLSDLGQMTAALSPNRQATLAAANATRQAEANERIRQAIVDLRAEGHRVATAEIARRARADRATVRCVRGGVRAGDEAVSYKNLLDDGSTTRPVHPESRRPPANAARHQEAVARIRRAAAKLCADGQPLTVSAVIRLVGGSRTTVGRVLAAMNAGPSSERQADLDTPASPALIPGRGSESDLPGEAITLQVAHDAARETPRMTIRWAAQRGWIRIRDPSTGESCEVRAHDCPDWVWQAARDWARRGKAS